MSSWILEENLLPWLYQAIIIPSYIINLILTFTDNCSYHPSSVKLLSLYSPGPLIPEIDWIYKISWGPAWQGSSSSCLCFLMQSSLSAPSIRNLLAVVMCQCFDFLLANINKGHIISIVNWKNTDKKHILLQQKKSRDQYNGPFIWLKSLNSNLKHV